MGVPILPWFATQIRETFTVLNELFDPALAVAQRAIAETDDRQQRGSARGMIPDPVGADVQPMRYFVGGEQWVCLKRLRGNYGQWHKA